MGVPHFFKYLVKSYPNIVFDRQEMEYMDHLCFDTNGLIHPCAGKINKLYNGKDISTQLLEQKIIDEVIRYIKFMINLIQPQKSIYISVDGPAPRAKMHQQRSRRFKSASTNEFIAQKREELGMDKLNDWNTNAITPGTEFMDNLMERLNWELKSIKSQIGNIDVIFSSSYVPCEGEHKIIDYIRKSNFDETDAIAIYGLDADLIFLSLVLNRPNMYLLREHVMMRGGKSDNNMLCREYDEIEFDYLSIDLLKSYFYHEVSENTNTKYDVNNLINDFIFICFLIGNDFLPNMNCIEIDLKGMDHLLKIYYEILQTEKYHLIHNKNINQNFLRNLFKKIAEKEDYLFRENFKLRCRWYNRKEYEHNNMLSQKENELKKAIHEHDCVISRERDFIRYGTDGYQQKFYKHYFNVRNENFEESIPEIIDNYLETLFWNFEYYFVGVKNFEVYYRYGKTPLASDIYEYLLTKPVIEYKFAKTQPPKPTTQLLMVLPPQSSELLPKNYQQLVKNANSQILMYYPSSFTCDMINKKFLHSCYANLPLIDYKHLNSVISSHKLLPNEAKRNKFTKDIRY